MVAIFDSNIVVDYLRDKDDTARRNSTPKSASTSNSKASPSPKTTSGLPLPPTLTG